MYISSNEVYKRQNRTFHRAFNDLGLPYQNNRDTWVSMAGGVIGRTLKGLSDMTLQERRNVIDYLNKKYGFTGKARLYNPRIHRSQNDWQKGDPETTPKNVSRPIQVDPVRMPLVKKIHALLTKYKKPWGYVDAIAKKRFGVDRVEFLGLEDLTKVTQMLIVYDKRRR